MAKKKTQKTKLVYVLDNGEKYEVIGETGKYYLCEGDTQFRKSANRGVLLKEEFPNEEAPQEETEG